MSTKKVGFGKVARFGLVGVGGILAVASIARGLSAGPRNVPRASDVVKAERTLPPQGPGGDPRIEVPEGDLVAGNGVVETYGQETKLAAELPGVVASVLVKEGERVEAGKVLVELANGAEKAALATAEAVVAQAQAELHKVQAGSRAEEIDAADREAAAAKARSSRARSIAVTAGT